jgi:PhnB protein
MSSQVNSKATVQPVPPGYHTATPYLVVRGGSRAIDFYKKAFGAKERFRFSRDNGKIAHGEIEIGDSYVMLADEAPEAGSRSPETVGGTPVSVFLYVEDVDAVFGKAVAAGAKPSLPPQNMFWGDRFAKVSDPFGHDWLIATHVEDVPPEEMERRMAAQR